VGSSVFANARTIVHAGDGLTFIAATPDVCKTPSPAGPVPVPYPNIAKSSDLADGTKTVKIQGKSAAVKGANLSTSTGDEAGTAGGGIISGKIKGKLIWMAQSMDVKFEGKGVIRFLDPNMHNGNAANDPSVNRGSPRPGHSGATKPLCPICGKPFEGHKDVIPKPSDRSDAEARAAVPPSGKPRQQWTPVQKRHSGEHMVSALVIECKDSGPQVFRYGAGNPRNPITQTNFASTAVNLLNGKSVGSVQTPEGSNPVGNCGEQSAAFMAKSHFPLNKEKGCTASLSAMENPAGKKRDPCATCQRVLTAMFCDEPKKDPPGGAGGSQGPQRKVRKARR